MSDGISTEKTTKGFMGFVKGAQDAAQDKMKKGLEEGRNLQGQLTQDITKHKENATSGWGKVRNRMSDIARQGKEARDNAQANFQAYQAENKQKIATEGLHGRLKDGATTLKKGAEDGYQQAVDGYKAAGQATEAAKQEAARVHAEEVLKSESDDGQEQRTEGEGEEQRTEGEGEEQRTEGEGEERKMEGGRRRRRRRSRKKKKKSKRKSRRKKTRKRKSRKSRKKRRKKSKKSRRRRRR